MLLWSRKSRALAWTVSGILFGLIFGLPLLTIVLMAFAGSWRGVLPSSYTVTNVAGALRGQAQAELVVSLLTGAVASLVSLAVGAWAALAKGGLWRRGQRLVDGLFLLPIAVPTVVVGLGLLVAFSRPPVAINGSALLVIIAHVVIVTAFSYSSVSASIARLDPSYPQVAASLGGRPGYVLRRIVLPLLTPGLVAAAGLAFALSMGELAATIMVYPPQWTTLPVAIQALTARGGVFTAAGMTVILLSATLIVLLAISRIRNRASYR